MPGHMDKGTKNYRNMMKRMEEGMGEEKVPASMNMGMESIKTLDRMGRENIPAKMDMGMDSMSRDDALKGATMASMADSMLDTEKESMMKMLQGMDFAPSDIKDAIEALMDMGFDRDAVLEILESTPGLIGNISNKPQVMPKTMTEGALGALSDTPKPMMRPKPMPERLDADRTQSMDMQKTGMGT